MSAPKYPIVYCPDWDQRKKLVHDLMRMGFGRAGKTDPSTLSDKYLIQDDFPCVSIEKSPIQYNICGFRNPRSALDRILTNSPAHMLRYIRQHNIRP